MRRRIAPLSPLFAAGIITLSFDGAATAPLASVAVIARRPATRRVRQEEG